MGEMLVFVRRILAQPPSHERAHANERATHVAAATEALEAGKKKGPGAPAHSVPVGAQPASRALALMRLLLARGADADARDNDGWAVGL